MVKRKTLRIGIIGSGGRGVGGYVRHFRAAPITAALTVSGSRNIIWIGFGPSGR